MKSQLHKNIMRRIWYVYSIWQIKKQLTTKAFWQGLVFGGSLILFAHVVHVASIFRNTLETPLGRVPEYLFVSVLGALRSGDLVKVITLLLLVSITISIFRKVSPVLRTNGHRQIV